MAKILKPFESFLNSKDWQIKPSTKKVEVKLSDMKDFFFDKQVIEEIMSSGENPVIYEYLEHSQPEVEGNLNFGITVIHPGIIGREYYQTRGHYHAKENTAEVYIGLTGEGFVLMQTKDEQVSCLPISQNKIVYVPPYWAHRTVNTGEEDLVFLYVYPSDAGHNYEIIKQKGFAKIVIHENGKPIVVDNPNYAKKT